MKQSILFTLVILATLSARGQMPHWVIKPMCDTIYVKDSNILEGENQGDNILWSMDGKVLYATTKLINTFNNGVATIQNNNSSVLDGFVHSNGIFTELPNVKVAHGYPYFEDGYLVAKQREEYVMYNKEGRSIELPSLLTLYPYSNELATYFAYQNPEKQKNPYFNLLLSDGAPVKNFVIKDKDKDKTKVIEPKDVSFMSSVDPNTGKALAVVKNKLYWFDKFEMCMLPILMEDNKGKMRQLELESGKTLTQIEFPIDSLTLVAKCGKEQTIEFRFDKLLRLLPKYVSASSSNKAIKQYEPSRYPTDLTVMSEGKEYGLELNNQYTVPAQFERVGLTYGNKAIVKTDGRWGVIEILPDCDYTLQLNDGNDIQFKHYIAKSSLRIDLPTSTVSDEVNIEIPDNSGLRLDKSSRQSKNTQQDNFVSYTCILDVPKALSDTISDVSFGPIELRVEGVRLPKRMINAKGIYVNPFTISFPEPNAEVAMGKAVFDMMVGCDNEAGIQSGPFEVSLEGKSLPSMVEKISENVYRCSVDELKSRLNSLTVKVTEKNCPAAEFPIKIAYSKVGKKETATVRDQTLEDLLNTPKVIVFDDGDIVVEVIANDAPLRTGPGMDYPQSTYYDEYSGRTNLTSPSKGDLIKVKAEGDWYLIAENMSNYDASKWDRGYIPKKYVKPVESTPFVINENANPALYVKIREEVDEEDYEYYCPEVIAIYPNGLFVVYYQDPWYVSFYFGSYSNGDPALIAKYRFSGTCINDTNTGTFPIISVGQAPEGSGIYIDYPAGKYLTAVYKKKKVEYPDLSMLSENQWLDILEKAKQNEHYNEFGVNVLSPESELKILTKDELEKNYTKVK